MSPRPSDQQPTQPPGGGADPGDAAWVELLQRLLGIAGEDRTLRALLRDAAELVVAATRSDACFVHVVDRSARQVVLMGATPDEFDALVGSIRLDFGHGLAPWVAEHGVPAVVEDKWSDPRYRYIPELRGEDFASMVSVPLLRPPQRVVGVLNVHSHRPGHFATDIVSRLEQVAALLAGIVETALLHEELRQREQTLEQFAVKTIELQELERRRVAGDIHDGISQRLVSAWYHLRAATAALGDGQGRGELEKAGELLSGALDEARRTISGLRPAVLDDLGLPAALQSLASSAGLFEAEVDVHDCGLAAHHEITIFRIAQEALQNAAKHAEATTVTVSLTASTEGAVSLVVSDDGKGFDPSTSQGAASFGLAGMRERAALLGAEIDVRSAPGQGTTVEVRLPPERAGDREQLSL